MYNSKKLCEDLVLGSDVDVAARLTEIVEDPTRVVVSANDTWETKIKLDKSQADNLIPSDIREELAKWWLASPKPITKTPQWCIVSTCKIERKPGLLLLEVKSKSSELNRSRKDPPVITGRGNEENHESIREAIEEANSGLNLAIKGNWQLSIDTHYQLSNRFAWAWKLTELDIPVVLVYLGIWNSGSGFKSKGIWENKMKEHYLNVVEESCWNQIHDLNQRPFGMFIRSKKW